MPFYFVNIFDDSASLLFSIAKRQTDKPRRALYFVPLFRGCSSDNNIVPACSSSSKSLLCVTTYSPCHHDLHCQPT